jgi:ABC-2 type transport system permease protein
MRASPSSEPQRAPERGRSSYWQAHVGLPPSAVAVPYVWYLRRGVGVVRTSLLNGHLVGSLASLVMVGLGLLISTYADSNRVSLSISVFTLLALFAPTQMPASAQRGWFGDLLLRADPFTAGVRYLGRTIVNSELWTGRPLAHRLGIAVGVALGQVVAVAGRLRRGFRGRG